MSNVGALRSWRDRAQSFATRGGFVRHALHLGGGTALGQAAVALAAPFLTRLYTPSEVALIGLVVSFVTFASVGLALRYDLAIVTAVNESEAVALLIAALTLPVLVSLVASVVLLVFVREHVLSYGLLPVWSVAATFGILVLVGIFTTLRYWYVRRNGFATISSSLVAQGFGRALIPLGAGMFHVGWVGLLIGELGGRALGVVRLVAGVGTALRGAAHTTYAQIRAAMVRNRKYPGVVLPSSLLDSAASMISIPIVVAYFGGANGGQFFLMQNMLGLPAVLIANSVADVLHAKLAEAYLKDPAEIVPIMRRALRYLTGIGIAIYLPIALLAPLLAGPILGRRWADAGMIALILAPTLVTGLVTNPPSRILVVVNRPEWKLLVDLLRLVGPPGVLVVCHHSGAGFHTSLLLFSLAASVANVVYIFIVWKASVAAPRIHAEDAFASAA